MYVPEVFVPKDFEFECKPSLFELNYRQLYINSRCLLDIPGAQLGPMSLYRVISFNNQPSEEIVLPFAETVRADILRCLGVVPDEEAAEDSGCVYTITRSIS